MLETSKDLLFVILAGCIGVFTVFLCWGIYYIVQILKNVFEIIGDIRKKIEEIEAKINSMKRRVDDSINSVKFAGDAAKTIFEYFVEKKKAKKTASKRGRKKKNEE